MKTRILSIFMVAALFISTATVAQNPRAPQKKKDGNEMKMKRFAQQKGEHQNFFNEEQKEAIKELQFERAKKVKPFKNELRELMAHQQTLTTADNTDLKAINKNIDEISKIKTEIAKIMAKQHQDVRSILTEEQLLKFDSMKSKHGKGQKPDSNLIHERMQKRVGHPQFKREG